MVTAEENSSGRDGVAGEQLVTSPEKWRVRGVRLYLLFAAHPEAKPYKSAQVNGLNAPDVEASAVPLRWTYWHQERPIEGWRLHMVSTYATVHPDGHKAAEPIFTLQQADTLLQAMLDEARRFELERSGSERTVQYAILHLRDLLPPEEMQAHMADSVLSPERVDPRSALHTLLSQFDHPQSDQPRGYFDHYEAKGAGHIEQRGYLGVGPRAALLAGLSDEAVQVLAALLQSGTLTTDRGFTHEGFAVVLGRLTQWNAIQDLTESVDRLTAVQTNLHETSVQLTELKNSSTAATLGQIWLSYALSAIGVALAFIAFIEPPLLLLPGLLCFGASCVAQSRYAQSEQIRWSMVGKVLFWCGVVLCLLGIGTALLLARLRIKVLG